MRIINFKAENFKRLKVVEITPDGPLVLVGGRNAQGKSSVLDAIWAAVAGRAGAKALEQPIREGEKKASVQVTLDDMVVTRTWTQGGTQLTVTPRDGSAKLNSPQKILDGLVGALSFDPLTFANAKPSDQRDMLIDLIGQREAYDEIETQRKDVYEERTVVNRIAKSARAKLEGLPQIEAFVGERVDVAALTAELGDAHHLDELRQRYRTIVGQLSALEKELEEVGEQAGALDGTRAVSVIQEQLAAAEAKNYAIDEAARRQDVIDEAEASEAQADDMTSSLQVLDEQKTALIANADLPVAGLGIDDDGVTLNGVAFVQASGAERIKTSVALAMAKNPDLRVIRITDGALLDNESMSALNQMALDNDFQIWVERVGDNDPIGVVIEDGEVRA